MVLVLLNRGGSPPSTEGGRRWAGIPDLGPLGGQALSPDEARKKADELAALTKNSDDPEFAIKGTAITNALVQAQQGDVAVPVLVEKLKSDYVPQRTHAATALRFLGPQAAKAIPALIAALKDPEYVVREAAIKALGWICSPGLGREPPDPTDVIQALIASLKDGTGAANDLNVNRLHAVQALARIGPPARAAVPHIVPLLKDAQAAARSNAASALGDLGGPAAAEALPTLKQLEANDPDQEVRRNAGSAVNKLQKP